MSRRVRAFVFRDRPDVLLLFAPEDGSIELPNISPPFDRSKVMAAFDEVEIDATVTESGGLGRWTQTEQVALNMDRAQRAQEQQTYDAQVALGLLASDDDLLRQRGEAIVRKQLVDDEVRALKTKVGKAKADAYHGKYLPPHKFRSLEKRLADGQQESLALQGLLTELREKMKSRNRDAERDDVGDADAGNGPE